MIFKYIMWKIELLFQKAQGKIFCIFDSLVFFAIFFMPYSEIPLVFYRGTNFFGGKLSWNVVMRLNYTYKICLDHYLFRVGKVYSFT